MTDTVALTYFGFSSFELSVGDTRLLFDPWISEPDWTPVGVDEFADVAYVFVTHGARDHLGDAPDIITAADATAITEPAVADHLLGLGIPESNVERVIWGNRFALGDINVRVLETRHLSYFESSVGRLSGISVGFYLDVGSTSVYYVGDTSLFSDLSLFVERYEPEYVLLPVGSAPGDYPPLPPDDAAVAAGWLADTQIIPVHYVPGSPELVAFENALGGDAGRVRSLEPGDRLTLG